MTLLLELEKKVTIIHSIYFAFPTRSILSQAEIRSHKEKQAAPSLPKRYLAFGFAA